MKKTHIYAIALLLLIGFVASAQAKERFVYSKPAFQGRMIDNETKEPLEGVVVVAVYWESYSFCLNPGGCNPSIAGAVETLTDKKGEFYLKPFKTWMGPFGYPGKIDFIIYKPGYASYPESMNKHPLRPLDLVRPEYFFAQELGNKGLVKPPALTWQAEEKKLSTVEVTFGIVEMPKLKDREDRVRALPSFPLDHDEKDLPLLYEQIKKDRMFLFNEK